MARRRLRTLSGQAFVSARNKGAGMAVGLIEPGRSTGIHRSAIVTLLPAAHGRVVLRDAGTDVDGTLQDLPQFGPMGSVCAHEVLGIPEPRVGLLNTGEEWCEGSRLCQEAYSLLKNAPIRTGAIQV
ncbi:MAG: hypothetical protein HY320_03655 [Armatimonadetes bacterium]|nr:hypothetical protein [Armatimonadota bacterium]